ncbi:hypothetical protein ACFMQL_23695 [Nonomuraea fastidiosa]|uniref:hypothetical protein n=1 Tax=Nonomuraea TaxID=83681 RepID=UPI003422D435
MIDAGCCDEWIAPLAGVGVDVAVCVLIDAESGESDDFDLVESGVSRSNPCRVCDDGSGESVNARKIPSMAVTSTPKAPAMGASWARLPGKMDLWGDKS